MEPDTFFNSDFFTFIAVVTIINIAAFWRIFEKAGKPGWASLIPIYNAIILLEIIGKPIWWIFMFFIPIANLIFGIWAINLVAKSFGKSAGFTVGLIFLSFIFCPILAFGNAAYIGPAGLAEGFNKET